MVKDRVLVVGAGIGGLCSAIWLARAGLSVTVCERAATSGGKMREVAAGGMPVDSGPTVMTMRWVFDELFEAAGSSLESDLRLTPASVLARHAWSADERLDLFADPERTESAIGDFAGAREAKGYRSFRAESRGIYQTLRDPFLRSGRTGPIGLAGRIGLARIGDLLAIRPFDTLWDALGAHFSDPRLRQLFGRYATYCGASPFSAPATLMLIAHVEQEGVWLVEGGMQNLARALEALATKCGVTFRHGAEVKALNVSSGRIAGATLSTGEDLLAEHIVLNADAAALASGGFGPSAAAALRWKSPPQRSLSALTFTMSASTQGFPLSRHNVFFSRDYATEFADIFQRERLPASPTIYVCAQDRDDASASCSGPERLMALVNAPATGDRHLFDSSEVQACQAQVFEHLNRCGLQVAPPSEPAVITTPTDFNRLFPATGGALYGQATHGWAAAFRRPGAHTRLPGLYLAGGSVHPGAGVPMAALSGRLAAAALLEDLDFDGPTPEGGYQWWYIDALSEDGLFGLTIIAFIGSVFSPYYAWSGWKDPLNHCAINVALYGPRGGRWAMTERKRRTVLQQADNLTIGSSRLEWSADGLTIHIDEICAPIPKRVRGTVRLRPDAINGHAFPLDAAGRHHWRPIAPRARVEAQFDTPDLKWCGEGYFDSNWGREPLERGFKAWDWSRAHLEQDTVLFYDVVRRDGVRADMALKFGADGAFEAIEPPPQVALPPTFWRTSRVTRSDAGAPPKVLRTLEDAPFYNRSALAGSLLGQPALIVHESLSLDRFTSPVVRAMLPFRMPRVFW